ncbi:hypothetical protein SAMN02745121_09042 [Nannocystis exedens]|uniref:Uncharacterized protein n=1 Tax=Nannocystis exedens TaxID=54 RepID=A0A1I2IYC2_9BACT|nr:hypothetical protein [Nannocystis exedens]PCC72965.1 hypothetical protein NAEX_06051 [Nannocystis exedens]SFF46613.1 hypothetical protein SAMN02745121_09042 [Nannocystis exedens]
MVVLVAGSVVVGVSVVVVDVVVVEVVGVEVVGVSVVVVVVVSSVVVDVSVEVVVEPDAEVLPSSPHAATTRINEESKESCRRESIPDFYHKPAGDHRRVRVLIS